MTDVVAARAPLFSPPERLRLGCVIPGFSERGTRESPVPETFHHDGVEHALRTTEPLLFSRPRRLPPDCLCKAHRDFELVQEICRPSANSWASSFLLVPKKDGSYQPCNGDYRRLNIPDRYPFPYLHDFTANLVRAYHQVPIDLMRSTRLPSPHRLALSSFR